jgi:2-oxoglutarate dehydrogenase complex dehydrogenase (E1) component-like enzyme
LEQFYPFPLKALKESLATYPNATQLVWAQEEPKNMGGWTFVEPRLEELLTGCARPLLCRSRSFSESCHRLLFDPPTRTSTFG